MQGVVLLLADLRNKEMHDEVEAQTGNDACDDGEDNVAKPEDSRGNLHPFSKSAEYPRDDRSAPLGIMVMSMQFFHM